MKRSPISLTVWFVVALGLLAIWGTSAAKADFTFGDPVTFPWRAEQGIILCFSYDGLELYTQGYDGAGDLYVQKRASLDDDWGTPENLGPLVNSSSTDSMASISGDGLTLYFNSDRPGGHGSWDIYMTRRATKNDPWGQAVNLPSPINTSDVDGEPWITQDGRELYFISYRPGGYGQADIYVTRRATQDDPWGEAVNLGPLVNTPYEEQMFCLSPDGLVLVFQDYYDSSDTPRPGGYGGGDLWMTRRTTLSEPWQPVVNLGPRVNGPSADGWPARILPDGRTLFLSSPGTRQAPIIPICDFNGDDRIDGNDLRIMAEHWGQGYPLCDIGPFAWGDGIVDTEDLLVFAEYIGTEAVQKEVVELGLVAHWALDETEGTIARDSSGFRGDGRVHGGAVWQPSGGMIGGALELNGLDGHVETPPLPAAMNEASDRAFSAFAWTKGGAPGQVIVSQTSGANWLMADAAGGTLTTQLRLSGRFPGVPLKSQAVITDGEWHRVGLTLDGSYRTLYVDDVEVARDTQVSQTTSLNGLYVGCGASQDPGTFWSGLIDDVRIYNRAVKP